MGNHFRFWPCSILSALVAGSFVTLEDAKCTDFTWHGWLVLHALAWASSSHAVVSSGAMLVMGGNRWKRKRLEKGINLPVVVIKLTMFN